jgi:hypothetical protein
MKKRSLKSVLVFISFLSVLSSPHGFEKSAFTATAAMDHGGGGDSSRGLGKDGDGDNAGGSLARLLPGTWRIVNKTVNEEFAGSTGQITFTGDTYKMDSGKFAVGNIFAPGAGDVCRVVADPIHYELLGDALIYATWISKSQVSPDVLVSAVFLVVSGSRDTLVLMGRGSGQCVTIGGPDEISILTRISR